MSNKYFLRIGDDTLNDVEEHATLGDAKAAFNEVAQELAGYGQRIEATVHIAPDADEVAEYPDYWLALGPRGGLQCSKC